jgi:hypothetical protein
MEKNKKKYFAFINYKRKDKEWAKWFKNELEYFHLLSALNGRAVIIEEIPEAFRPPKDFDAAKFERKVQLVKNKLFANYKIETGT